MNEVGCVGLARWDTIPLCLVPLRDQKARSLSQPLARSQVRFRVDEMKVLLGCDIYGSPDGLGSCQDWNATSGNVAYGMNDGLDSWLHSGVVSCAELLHIYCISNLDTVTVWTVMFSICRLFYLDMLLIF